MLSLRRLLALLALQALLALCLLGTAGVAMALEEGDAAEALFAGGRLQGVLQLEDTLMAPLEEKGFESIEEAKETMVALIEAQDWLGFKDYVAVETLLEDFYLYGGEDFETVFSEAMARKFYAYYDEEMEFSLKLLEETDLDEIKQYTLIYTNESDGNVLFLFLERKGGRWFLMVDTRAAGYQLHTLYTRPERQALDAMLAQAEEELLALPLCSMVDRTGQMTALLYLSAAPEGKDLILHTPEGDVRGALEVLGDGSGPLLVRAGTLVSEEAFTAIEGVTLVNTKGKKIAYQLAR